MRINKKADNLVLTYTYCDLCGSIVGGRGRLNLSVSFDEDFVRMDEDLDTSISANVCVTCAKKLVRGVAERINSTELNVVEVKAQIGLGFNTAISSISDNPVIEAPNDETVGAETIKEEDIEEENEEEPIEAIPMVHFNDTKVSFNDEAKENLATFCEIYKGQVKNEQEFINDFVHEFPIFSDIIGPMLYAEAIEYIRKIIRDNSDYRLKVFGSGWFLQYLLDSTVVKEETKDEEMVEQTKPKTSTACKQWTEEETKFLMDNYKKIGAKECAKRLKRTYYSVTTRYKEINGCSGKYHKWSEEETKFLMDNYKKLGAKECGKLLNVPDYSCTNKYNRMVKH